MLKLAVAGATGNVGREMLNILAERRFPADEVVALASRRSVGERLRFGDDEEALKVRDLETYDFAGTQMALFACGSEATAVHAPRAAAAGCLVIDNSSLYRMEPDVPLIVPEVNPEAIERARRRNLIANPNCSTAQLVVALKPLHDLMPIRRVVVATYQSVSGAGKAGMDELFEQTRSVFVGDPKERRAFTKSIAFNIIPHIDRFMGPDSDYDGYTREEWKMAAEVRRLLDPDILVSATCVRVPVFVGHSEAVHVEFDGPLSLDDARAALESAPGVLVIDRREDEGYVTPAEIAGEDPVYVSRLRVDPTVEHGLAFWCVADNLRKGAALNAVQIAELAAREALGLELDA